MNVNKKFPSFLKYFCTELNIKNSDIHHKTGWSRQRVSKYFQDGIGININKLTFLVDKLGLDHDKVIGVIDRYVRILRENR